MSSLDFSIAEDSVDSASGLLTCYRNWRRTNPTEEFSVFVSLRSNIEDQTLIELATTDLIHVISHGYDQRAETYIDVSPKIYESSEFILDLIDAEICTRSDLGEIVDQASVIERFPDLKTEIERMFNIHDIDMEASSLVASDEFSPCRNADEYELRVRLNGSDEDGFELWQVVSCKSGEEFTLIIWDLPEGMPESALLKKLDTRKSIHHSALAKLVDYGSLSSEENGDTQIYAVFEFVTGNTLFDLLDSPWIQQVPDETTIGWITRILQAHKVVAGEFHYPLEIGLKDVLIDSNNQPMLIDFRLHSPWSIENTDAARDKATDERSALRAFGLLTFAICLQETDFEELETLLVDGFEPIKISDVDPSISKSLNDIYLACVHPKAKHRYRSLEYLEDDLKRLSTGKSIKATRLQRRWF